MSEKRTRAEIDFATWEESERSFSFYIDQLADPNAALRDAFMCGWKSACKEAMLETCVSADRGSGTVGARDCFEIRNAIQELFEEAVQ